jgi:hypothetical protein
LLVIPKGVELTPAGLSITGKLSYGEWADLAGKMQHIYRLIKWRLGDLFVWGQDTFGEEFSQAIEEHSAESVRNAMWVSSRIEPVRRLTNLSWSHHQAVASLEPKEQDRLLALTVEKELTVGELRKAVQDFKALLRPEKKSDWQEPADPPEIIPDDEEIETGEQIMPAVTQRSSLEFEFKHLLDLCRALRAAEKEHSEDDAVRLRTALDVFIAQHEADSK